MSMSRRRAATVAAGVLGAVVLGALLWHFSLSGWVRQDGPVVTARKPWVSRHGDIDLLVDIRGRLELRGDCLQLDGTPVVWPPGTEWHAGDRTVETPNHRTARLGDEVDGAGFVYGESTGSDWWTTDLGRTMSDCRRDGRGVQVLDESIPLRVPKP